jgi:hypothetical protein
VFVLTDARSLFDLTRLFVGELFVLLHQSEGYGQRNLARAVERSDKVDALDAFACRVVIVPADQLALVGVRLVRDAVIQDKNCVIILHLSHERLNDLPEIGGSEGTLRQETRDLIVANAAGQQARKACGCRGAKRGNQVIGVQIKQRFIEQGLVHTTSLPDENQEGRHSSRCLRNISSLIAFTFTSTHSSQLSRRSLELTKKAA